MEGRLMKPDTTIQDILKGYIGKKIKVYFEVDESGENGWHGVLKKVLGNWIMVEDDGIEEVLNLKKISAIQLDYDYDKEYIEDNYDDDEDDYY